MKYYGSMQPSSSVQVPSGLGGTVSAHNRLGLGPASLAFWLLHSFSSCNNYHFIAFSAIHTIVYMALFYSLSILLSIDVNSGFARKRSLLIAYWWLCSPSGWRRHGNALEDVNKVLFERRQHWLKMVLLLEKLMKCTLRWKQAEDAASWRQCWLEMAQAADAAGWRWHWLQMALLLET